MLQKLSLYEFSFVIDYWMTTHWHLEALQNLIDTSGKVLIFGKKKLVFQNPCYNGAHVSWLWFWVESQFPTERGLKKALKITTGRPPL
jgi:hypothetical protein